MIANAIVSCAFHIQVKFLSPSSSLVSLLPSSPIACLHFIHASCGTGAGTGSYLCCLQEALAAMRDQDQDPPVSSPVQVAARPGPSIIPIPIPSSLRHTYPRPPRCFSTRRFVEVDKFIPPFLFLFFYRISLTCPLDPSCVTKSRCFSLIMTSFFFLVWSWIRSSHPPAFARHH